MAVQQRSAADRIERELDRMTQRLAADLRGAKGDARKEEAALRAALTAYGAARVRLGAPATEHAVRFFSVDGVGYQRPRTPALAAARGAAPDQARWLKTLQRLVAGEKDQHGLPQTTPAPKKTAPRKRRRPS